VVGPEGLDTAKCLGRIPPAMQTLLQVVLTAWREAERVASERPADSAEHLAALVAAERLRDLYRELVASARTDHDATALAAAQTLGAFPEP
jgi:hypothetical protein